MPKSKIKSSELFTGHFRHRPLKSFKMFPGVELHCTFINIFIGFGTQCCTEGVIVSPSDYLRFVVNFDFYYFPDFNLEYQNKAKNIPVALPSSLI